MTDARFANATSKGEIPTYGGSDKEKATDFANYFCSYAQLYHQKQMLVDHNRMAAYHSAIMGNSELFKDKVVMDVGTGSGILAVWAAQAGARRVYAVEYTNMAKHATSVMEANGVADIVTVIQGAVEEIELPKEDFPDLMNTDGEENGDVTTTVTNGVDGKGGTKGGTGPIHCVDIMISEWMGYFLLRESMLDSLIRARDKFLKPNVGLMFPSHCAMYIAPITDEEERHVANREYGDAMRDWNEFVDNTRSSYGVDMGVLHHDFEREQREYYLLSSRWAELTPDVVLATPQVVKTYDMAVCTLADARGISLEDDADKAGGGTFDFDVVGPGLGKMETTWEVDGPISGFAGWFHADFKSRTDEFGKDVAPTVENPASLSTGPENGYTHWGQQAFHLLSSIPLIKGETTRLRGTLEMTRSDDNSRLYNCRITFTSSRRKSSENREGKILMKSGVVSHVYQIP